MSSATPFVFIIDFDMQNPLVYSIDTLEKEGFLFDIKGKTNGSKKSIQLNDIQLKINPLSQKIYDKAFDEVQVNINKGNSFLLNLTFPSEIETPATLEDIFYSARAPYKLFRKDKFVVYSPECFVKIKDGYIYSYPMKGTIDANLPDAECILLNSQKEIREHNTIVDLIRNDLSMVATEVTVTKFRYVEKIKSHQNEILQTSSEIRGKLPDNWENNFSDLLLKLLPAGSICGAPKTKTIEIINSVEMNNRGYYTGVFGIFDGKNIDSAVSIRFIEKDDNTLWYRSGGGITALSNADEEYQELINKIHVPTN
ncbi:aminodeoxychorismate synthase component I [Aurantibacter crassamenti]|uniref:aminodeoxychorismate synthase component I n=1 Tax=Aurantibacter crassamenti TaxID=1837375 RepID=UPI00193AA0E8|nr:aminodeoxychorismate synthase component I [Aurantibacter crassamenti]MBM1107627.1 aminodeoxychorismate synthase component I [Aurantibacter crassamenti]